MCPVGRSAYEKLTQASFHSHRRRAACLMWPEAESYDTSCLRLPQLASCMYTPYWLPVSGKPQSSMLSQGLTQATSLNTAATTRLMGPRPAEL